MKENFEKNLQNVYQVLDESIKNAVKNPIDIKELNQVFDESEMAVTSGGTEEQNKTLHKKLAASKIMCSTLPEYRYVLQKLGYSPDQIEVLLKHENSHGNMADSLGANHLGYMIIIFKNGNIIGVRQGAEIAYPETSDYEDIVKKVAEAPEVYESMNLSDGDKRMAKRGSE
jgi:hypothetical protein